MLDEPTGGPDRGGRSAQRNLAWAICLLILALGALALVTGCGSDTTPEATEHYANAKYGFSFDYPASVTVAVNLRRAANVEQVVISTSKRQVDEFGLFVRDSSVDPKTLEDNYVLLLVSSADHEVTDAEARAALKARLSELQRKAARPSMGYDILDSSISAKGGISTLDVTYDCDLRPEIQRTERIWFRVFVKGRRIYLLAYGTEDKSFDHDVEQFASVMESFTIE